MSKTEKDTARYTSKRIDIDSLLTDEGGAVSKKLDLDDLLGLGGDIRTTASPVIRKEKEVRHLSPGEYIIVISLILTSLYLLVTSFFPLVYNIVTSFEPVNFLMNLLYFILGIGCLAGVFLVLKKETHLEHIADETFDQVVYKRLEPVLRDVADVQVGLNDVHNQLEMMNLNINKIGKVRETTAHTRQEATPAQSSMYIKYVVLINITLATFLFMLQYPLEYIPYAVTVVYIIWWAVITQEFKLWNVESVWMWAFVPILILPVYTIIMNAYLLNYQMFGSLFIGLCVYIISYYSWCSNMVRGELPFDLHLKLAELKKKLKEKTPAEIPKTNGSIPRIDLKKPKLSLYQFGISMVVVSIVLCTSAWFGYSVEHGLIPNVTWENFGIENFTWKPAYSYALTSLGMVFLGLGFGMVLKSRRRRY